MKKKRQIVFLLTLEQWLGVAILAGLVGVTVFLLQHMEPQKEEATMQVNDSTLAEFATHQAEQDSIRKAAWKKKYPHDTIAIRMQMFDPNTADSSTLVHVGLKKWQASNMLKYRAKGGRYRRAEDMKKIYGMTDSMYMALLPYIQIDTVAVDHYRDSIRQRERDSVKVDSMPRYVSQKRDTILNLRTADTTELKMIRGIGSYRARQIVRYREQLGGYAHVDQLCEIKALQPLLTDSIQADSLLAHFWLDSVIINPLRVNSASVEKLQRHPYLSFEQAKAIYELRRKKIHLDSIAQLKKAECFTEQELKRLTPYLSFERYVR
jgi:DNA uptake protein ComE-like DNA-binding protein